jgi:hypothetical protein
MTSGLVCNLRKRVASPMRAFAYRQAVDESDERLQALPELLQLTTR